MEKNKIKIIIGDIPPSWNMGQGIAGLVVNLVDWDFGDNGWMFDSSLCEEFPELEDLDIVDSGEGQIEYYGNLSKEQLVNKLKGEGFESELGDLNKPFPLW
jgi:hypothetical protein